MKLKQKILSLALVVCLLMAFAPFAFAESYKKGSVIEYGSYPQTRVTDSLFISELEAELNSLIDKNSTSWKSYDYYSGSGSRTDGNMHPGSFMQYADFSYKTVSYRAVKFSAYRPSYTGYALDNNKLNTLQDDYNLVCDKTYFYIFKPLKWIVLDPEIGLIVCQSAIDAQPFQNTVLQRGDQYYQNASASSALANNFAKSSIRKWLNQKFIETAFTDKLLSNIKTVSFDDGMGGSINERIYLLTQDEADTLSSSSKKASATSYAKCMGLQVSSASQSSGTARWWLRDGAADSSSALVVSANGRSTSDTSTVDATMIGVRPACRMIGMMTNDDLCPLCGSKHTGTFGFITKFFHGMLYRFRTFILKIA